MVVVCVGGGLNIFIPMGIILLRQNAAKRSHYPSLQSEATTESAVEEVTVVGSGFPTITRRHRNFVEFFFKQIPLRRII